MKLLGKFFRWEPGRRLTGYEKMLLATNRRVLSFDLYLLRYKVGSHVPPHVDPVDDKKHFRLNIILREAKLGRDFSADRVIFASRRIKLFRPDIAKHSVSPILSGERLVLSLGWVRNGKPDSLR